jgi:hypothetical protein
MSISHSVLHEILLVGEILMNHSLRYTTVTRDLLDRYGVKSMSARHLVGGSPQLNPPECADRGEAGHS